MPTVLEHREVTARKDHKCRVCYEVIEKGSKYWRQACAMDGTAYTWKEHPECRLLFNAAWDYWDIEPWEGMDAEGVIEWMREFDRQNAVTVGGERGGHLWDKWIGT